MKVRVGSQQADSGGADLGLAVTGVFAVNHGTGHSTNPNRIFNGRIVLPAAGTIPRKTGSGAVPEDQILDDEIELESALPSANGPILDYEKN
jgi:hypothetical protein